MVRVGLCGKRGVDGPRGEDAPPLIELGRVEVLDEEAGLLARTAFPSEAGDGPKVAGEIERFDAIKGTGDGAGEFFEFTNGLEAQQVRAACRFDADLVGKLMQRRVDFVLKQAGAGGAGTVSEFASVENDDRASGVESRKRPALPRARRR